MRPLVLAAGGSSGEDMKAIANIEGIGRCGRHPDSIEDMLNLFGPTPWQTWKQDRQELLKTL